MSDKDVIRKNDFESKVKNDIMEKKYKFYMELSCDKAIENT